MNQQDMNLLQWETPAAGTALAQGISTHQGAFWGGKTQLGGRSSFTSQGFLPGHQCGVEPSQKDPPKEQRPCRLQLLQSVGRSAGSSLTHE